MTGSQLVRGSDTERKGWDKGLGMRVQGEQQEKEGRQERRGGREGRERSS